VLLVSPGRAGLNDRVELTVDHLAPLQEAAKGRKIVLFINAMEIPRCYPETILPLPDGKGTLRFNLERTADSKKAWTALLGSPVFERSFPLSVGVEGGTPLQTAVSDFRLVVMRVAWFWVWLGTMGVVLFVLFRFSRKSDLLRGSGPENLTDFHRDLGIQVHPEERRPFSLAQTQMAFWTVLILGSFFFIWAVTSDRDIVPDTVLVLMGIGTGTALGASMVDTGKRSSAEAEARSLLREKKMLAAELVSDRAQLSIAPPPPNLETLRQNVTKGDARVTEISHRLSELVPVLEGGVSKNFFQDLLSDENGVSLHRFQMLCWTLVLGVVFVVGVYTDLGMPTFSGTLLALLGISSGTYLGFKVPEKK
jgi:hypothetical protein